MTPIRRAAAVLVLLALAGASPAWGQDDGSAEPAAEPEPPLEGVETTEEWERFSRIFAQELRQQGRIPDAVEEYVAVAALRPADRDVVADAAVLLVDHASGLAHGLQAGSPYLLTAESLVHMGVAREGVGDARLAYVIGRLRLADGSWRVAHQMLNEAGAAGFPPERLHHWIFIAAVNRAPELLQEGRAPEVIEELERLIREQPNHPQIVEGRLNLAAAYRRNNDRVRSQEILEELTRRYPQDHRAWSGLGREHLDQHRLDEALDAYRKALALSGADRDAYAQSLASIALVLYKLGRLDESEQAARGFMELDSASAPGLYLLAMLERERGETLEAIKLLRRAERLDRDDPTILTLLEQIHYERGEHEEARQVRERRDARYREPGKPSEREKAEDGDPAGEDDAAE